MNYLKLKYILAIWTVFGLNGCKDSESYDIVGNAASLAYIATVSQSSSDPQNQKTFKVIQTPVGIVGSVSLKFPVKVNKLSSAFQSNLLVDYSQLNAYNAKFGTDCRPLPESVLTLTNTNVVIKQGETVSQDSVSFLVDNEKLGGLDPGDYLVPIKLATVSNGVQISSNLNTVYVKIQVEKVSQLGKANVAPADMLGTLLTSSSYTTWTYTSHHTTSPIANLWSTSTNSFLTLTANPATIVFDMKTLNKISGLRLYSRSATSTSAVNTFSNVKFSLSKDGVSYTEIADFSREKMNTVSGYQYIGMHAPLEAQFIKLELASPQNGLVFLGAYRVQ